MGARQGTTSGTSSSDDAEIDSNAVSIVTGAVRQIADVMPSDRVLLLAICEPGGLPTDVVLRDSDGRLEVVAGVPEDRRPDLAELLSLADTVEDAQPRATQAVARIGNDLHRTIVEESPLPLILLDREGAVVYVSPSVAYDLGWSKAELIGHRLLDFVHAEDRDRASRVMFGAAATQRLGTAMTLRWRRQHSGYVAVEAAIRPLVGDAGDEVQGAVIALRTNPLQWRGLGEVLLARERQQALADGADSGMAIVSGSEPTLGAVLEANTPLGRMVGVTRGQLAGLPLTSLITEDEAGQVREAFKTVADNGGTNTIEATVVPKIGRQRLVTITVAPALHSEQPGSELVVRLQDTTEHSGLLDELSRTVDRLERSNEELAGLARITAHDLAAPLRALSGLVDLLPQADTTPDTRLTFDAIRSSIDRMQAMVSGVTGYVQARWVEPKRMLVDLNTLTAHVTETLRYEIEERRAKVIVEGLPSIFGDEHQLERVFLNLISNALKYSGERPPEISVYANRAPGAWRISIADHGIGVEEADRGRIFELFSRGHTDGPGSGIGLATCRRIVELHGGRIEVEPNEPVGAIFSFTIPDEPTIAGG
jgi:PAS domain S-box-containing protein